MIGMVAMVGLVLGAGMLGWAWKSPPATNQATALSGGGVVVLLVSVAGLILSLLE